MLQLKILTLGSSFIVALSANLVTFILVEQRTPERSRSSFTLNDSYAILLDGKMMENPLLEVKVIVLSRLIGNCFTDVSMVGIVVVVVEVVSSDVGLVVLEM